MSPREGPPIRRDTRRRRRRGKKSRDNRPVPPGVAQKAKAAPGKEREATAQAMHTRKNIVPKTRASSGAAARRALQRRKGSRRTHSPLRRKTGSVQLRAVYSLPLGSGGSSSLFGCPPSFSRCNSPAGPPRWAGSSTRTASGERDASAGPEGSSEAGGRSCWRLQSGAKCMAGCLNDHGRAHSGIQ